MGRQPHHPPLAERFEQAPPAPENPTPVEAMAHRLRTPEGRKVYALRKQNPEPVFGIIKAALEFRQFSLCGLDKVRGEWTLVTMAWNIKRMFRHQPRRTRPCAWREKADGSTKRPAEAGRGKIVLGVLLQNLSQTGC
jgi:Transposase DDE domain